MRVRWMVMAAWIGALGGVAQAVNPAVWESFARRLAALSPDDPMAYFELGEEVAYEAPDVRGKRLATELFVLAAELDRRRDHPVPLGRSVCLALADLSTDGAERTWLIAMARSQAPAGGEAESSGTAMAQAFPAETRAEARGERTARNEAALALARFRGGDARSVKSVLDSGDLARALTDAGVPRDQATEVLALLDRKIPAVRHQRSSDSDGRFVRTLTEGVTTLRLDPETGGNPGPELDDRETKLVLGVEARLLGAEPSSWAADMVVTDSRPVRDINPGALPGYFGVDPSKPWFVIDPARPNDPSAGRWGASRPGSGAGSDHEPEAGVGDQRDQQHGQVDDRRDEQAAG